LAAAISRSTDRLSHIITGKELPMFPKYGGNSNFYALLAAKNKVYLYKLVTKCYRGVSEGP
jgi:hypothetical protein